MGKQGSHRRVDGLTVEQRVWKWLLAHPGQKMGEVAKGLGIERHRCTDALSRMRKRGCVVSAGRSVATRWSVAGSVMPADMRGQMAGSIAARLLKQRPHVKINYTEDKRFHPRMAVRVGQPTIALEHAWGFGCEAPSSRAANGGEVDGDCGNLDNHGGKESPQKAA